MDKVSEIVKKQLAVAKDQKVVAETKFTDLGADSLDTVYSSIILSVISNTSGH